MTKEQKARAYDEALERARKRVLIEPQDHTDTILKDIFPELRESEDERTRKAIESIIRVYEKTQGEWVAGYDMDTLVVHLRKAFMALEKQREHPTDAKLERVIKAARRVLNNWLDGTDCPDVSGDFGELEFAIREYDGEEQQKEQSFTHHEIDESLRDAVTHQMEDDGDVDDFVRRGIDDIALRYATLGAEWQKEQKPANESNMHEPTLDEARKWNEAYEKGYSLGYENGRNEQKPVENINKSANDFAKEYSFNIESKLYPQLIGKQKELWRSEIEEAVINGFKEGAKLSKDRQKPAEWSEEDEENFKWFDKFFRAESIMTGGKDIPMDKYLWFKSLRPQPKQEWSEEDEENLERVIDCVYEFYPDPVMKYKLKDWLNSLRSQLKVEWSEEDEKKIRRLRSILNRLAVYDDALDVNGDYCDGDYAELDDWLKSLRLQPKQNANDIITPNKRFFKWIYGRLVNVHKENPNVDYMISFKKRIEELSFDEPHLKINKEQMDALKNVAYGYYQNSDMPLLHELHEQLKKLM